MSNSKYVTRFEPAAQADLRKIPKRQAIAILRKLGDLETDPYGFGTTAMVSQPDRRRLRVGVYRLSYTVDNGELVVWVLKVGHRSTVYE
ncbi:mRNA interferase RelE/StbE [Murinocardiopsis flavida]|uniref:mRNA interferase RelE/StbE n=1 Tax=Murinocardiopsis flavida TaxID=645275 RepID=A0A2P8DKQ4_9ACTN|nr:type II toxin-antitoxin system RelE/ParE family toxin [Murinocardiopsis flavida]PSK97805.1 mRNA interferase RelE/StbE [Murinocardiopsis flavida]